MITPERTLLYDGLPVVLPRDSFVFVEGCGRRDPKLITIVRPDVLAFLREIDEKLIQILPPEAKYKRLFIHKGCDTFHCNWLHLGENERLILGLDTLFITQLVFDKFDVSTCVEKHLLVDTLTSVTDVNTLLSKRLAQVTLN